MDSLATEERVARIEYGAWGLGLLILVFGHWPGQAPSLLFKRSLFLLVSVFGVCVSFRRISESFESLALRPVGLTVFLGWLAMIGSVYRTQGNLEPLTLWVPGGGWLLFHWARSLSKNSPDGLSLGVSVSAIGLTLWSFLQLIPHPWLSFASLPGLEQPVGTLGNKNQVAYFLALALPDVWALSKAKRSWFRHAAYPAILALLVLLTCIGSVGPWLSLLWMILGGVLLRKRPSRWRTGLLSGLLLLGLSLPWLIRTLPPSVQPSTFRTRLFAWELLENRWNDRFWSGHGAGSFAKNFPKWKELHFCNLSGDAFLNEARRARVKRQAHNELLQLHYEWGALVLLCGGLFVFFCGSGCQASRNPEEPWDSPNLGKLVLLGATIPFGFHFPLQVAPQSFLLVLALARLQRSDSGKSEVSSKTARAIVFSLACGCAYAGGVFFHQEWVLFEARRVRRADPTRSERLLSDLIETRPVALAHTVRGDLAFSRSNFREASHHFEQVEILAPSYASALNLGLSEWGLRKARSAGLAFEKAWFRQPGQETGFYWGAFLKRRGAKDEARLVWDQARQLLPKTGKPGYALAQLSFQEGKLDRARKVLEEELNWDPSAPRSVSGRSVDRVRMRMECIRLLHFILLRQNERTLAETLLLQWQREFPGVSMSALGPVGLEESL